MSGFVHRSIADEVNKNDEKNVDGIDFEKKEQIKMAHISAQMLSKRNARQPATVRRKLMAMNNKTHDYVTLLQQANANFETENGKYNTIFK